MSQKATNYNSTLNLTRVYPLPIQNSTLALLCQLFALNLLIYKKYIHLFSNKTIHLISPTKQKPLPF